MKQAVFKYIEVDCNRNRRHSANGFISPELFEAQKVAWRGVPCSRVGSRRVLSWRVSNTLDTSFCIDALEEAIESHGSPEVFNTDKGSQFTSDEFTRVLKDHGIKISMDGKGRWVDNVFVERLWRSMKYEEVYLSAYDSIGADLLSSGSPTKSMGSI